jgi:hypothetical protein
VELATVQLSCASCRKLLSAVGAGEGLAKMLFLEGLLAVDVIHFDVRAPALTRENTLAASMHAAEMNLAHLVVLFVDFRRVNARRKVDGLLGLLGHVHHGDEGRAHRGHLELNWTVFVCLKGERVR